MPLQHLYLIGGQQKSPRPLLSVEKDWYQYQKGIILHIDLESGAVKTCLDYTSKPDTCAPGDPILFKAGSIQDDRLYVCTQTEVIVCALPAFEVIHHISLPCFNDVHHVLPTPTGNLLVANSGLEMVLEIKPDGHVLREWNVLGEGPWQHFSRQMDYRKGINLKPHRAHPNYIFYIGDEIWVTRFELRDVICLTHPNRRLSIGLERIHDGTFHKERLYFTTVNGNLVIANPATLEIEEVVDLNAIDGGQTLLGWCRGLLVEGDRIWVGFSRIRPTQFREAVSWIRQSFLQQLPSHIACYDLNRRQRLTMIDVEAHGLNAVFSILPATLS